MTAEEKQILTSSLPAEKKPKRTLFSIGDDLTALADLLFDMEGEVTGETEATIDKWFAELNDAVEQKVDGYCALIREIEFRADARKAEAGRLRARAEIDASAAKRLRDRLKVFMVTHGKSKIETPRFQVSVAGNGGLEPMDIDPIDLNEIPAQFVKFDPSLDKDAVRQVLERGFKLDFARLRERGTSLRIR